MHIESTYTPHIYIYTWLATQITATQMTHRNTDNTNGLILLPSLAEQDGHLLVGIYTPMYKAFYVLTLLFPILTPP